MTGAAVVAGEYSKAKQSNTFGDGKKEINKQVMETTTEKNTASSFYFKVYRWNSEWQPEDWRWLQYPTRPGQVENGPYPTKEAAKAAGEAAGGEFAGWGDEF